MADFYARMAATVVRLLAAYGAPVTLARQTGTADPVEGELIKAAESLLTTTGVMPSLSSKWASDRLVPGAEALIVIDGTVMPAIDDFAIVDGTRYTIMVINLVQPAATPLAYVLHVKR